MSLLIAVILLLACATATVREVSVKRGFSYPPEMINSGGWLKDPHTEKRLK